VQKIDAVRHKDKRKNIPTEELRDFVAEEQQAPREVKYPGLLYARDPSLDPQLVWKGNVEQDSRPIEVPAAPMYIQEKIHPQAIIEDFRRAARPPRGANACGHRRLHLPVRLSRAAGPVARQRHGAIERSCHVLLTERRDPAL
jgi:hypothetical protein